MENHESQLFGPCVGKTPSLCLHSHPILMYWHIWYQSDLFPIVEPAETTWKLIIWVLISILIQFWWFICDLSLDTIISFFCSEVFCRFLCVFLHMTCCCMTTTHKCKGTVIGNYNCICVLFQRSCTNLSNAHIWYGPHIKLIVDSQKNYNLNLLLRMAV